MPEDYPWHPLRKDFPLRGRFSRAEQTRRALVQDPEHYYMQEDFDVGGAPAVPDPVEPPTGSESA